MSKESNGSKFSLQSSMKTFSPRNEFIGTLNAPNFFILPEYEGTDFNETSPPFECGNATWQINFRRFSLFGKRDDASFEVNLLTKNSVVEQPAIICTIDLLDTYGEKYDSCHNIFLLNDEYDEEDEDNDYKEVLYMGSFKIKNSSYDRRDIFTMIIHLICGKSFKVITDQAPDTTVEGK